MSRIYAQEITKEYLKKLGVEFVSTDGETVTVKGKTVKLHTITSGKKKYKIVQLYDPEIRASIPEEERTNTSGQLHLGAHVVNYVWNKGDRPEGMIIDHIDNNSLNNHIDNLQLLTPSENVCKERILSTRELKCNLSKPRSHYENKLEGFTIAYEQAKKDKDAKAAHRLRGDISQTKARLRYYDNHIEEYLNKLATEAAKQDYHARAAKRRELKNNIDTARNNYQEALETCGPDNQTVKQLFMEWKNAIYESKAFEAENKRSK